nr:MAG TPA: hypothetical protein [Caudoviricetes sp.]
MKKYLGGAENPNQSQKQNGTGVLPIIVNVYNFPNIFSINIYFLANYFAK